MLNIKTSGFSFKSFIHIAAVSSSVIFAGCNDSSISTITDTSKLQSVIRAQGITGDPTTGRTLPSITDPKAELGKKLFFTKGLGGDSDTACVSCHHPVLGGGDNLPLSIGTEAVSPDLLGSGRFHASDGTHFDGGPTVPRNAPTTFNLALWDQALFHDGRVESLGKTPGKNGNDGAGIRTPDSAINVADTNAGSTLSEAQARFPVTSPEEMRGFTFEANNNNAAVRTSLETKMSTLGWSTEFTSVFGDPDITYGRIAEAIAEYENSQVFIDTPWKSFVEGNEDAISDSAKRGALMFFNTQDKGGAGCASCHSGDFFTDEKYYVTAIPQIGRGKGDNNGTLSNDDFGRSRETNDSNDKYKFRTPTLLNVEMTGPWGHTGAYTQLEDIVKHMLNPETAITNYDFLQLDPSIQAADMQTNTQFSLNQLESNRSNNVTNVLQNITYTDSDVDDLVAFLKTLTDPCVKDRACLAPWIPDASDTNPDGLRLNAFNNLGDYL